MNINSQKVFTLPSESSVNNGEKPDINSKPDAKRKKHYVNMAYVDEASVSESLQGNNSGEKQVLPPSFDEDTPQCGLNKCRPRSMQTCANLACFTTTYCLANLMTQTLTVYLTTQITSIEKQFGFSSSQVGILLSGNDIGFVVTVLFVSHFAKRSHIPRFLGGSTVLFGLSGLMCLVAYFIDYSPNMSGFANNTTSSNKQDFERLVCNKTDAFTNDCSEKSLKTQARQSYNAFLVFMIGMLLQGIAKSPRTSLLTTYIDNNVSEKTMTGSYMGIITAMSIFGPSIAFLLGGVFSKIPVDLKDSGWTPEDPRWIGAWWMGFVLFGVISIFVSIPLFFFPKSFKREPVYTQYANKDIVTRVKDLPISIWRLLHCPVYILTLLSICTMIFGVSGYLAFNPKYVERQFNTPAWKTNLLLGGEKVVGAAIGTILGGVITTRLKLNRLGCLKLYVISAALSSCCEALGFPFGCPTPLVNGLTPEYEPKSLNMNVDRLCSTLCKCANDFYPVCGSNSQNYLSPCVAGCTAVNKTNFTSCDCIGDYATAASGLCETDCPYLYPYIAAQTLKSFVTTFAIVPGIMIILRSVTDEDKSIAIGAMSFLTSLVGWLTGPIVFGALFDTTCIHWSEICGVRAECQMYDLVDMRIKYHVAMMCVRLGSGILIIAAFLVAYFQEKKLNAKGIAENKFSVKMTFNETKSIGFSPKGESRLTAYSSKIDVLKVDGSTTGGMENGTTNKNDHRNFNGNSDAICTHL